MDKDTKITVVDPRPFKILEFIEFGWFQFDHWSDGTWTLSGPGGDYLTEINNELLEKLRQAVMRIENTQ